MYAFPGDAQGSLTAFCEVPVVALRFALFEIMNDGDSTTDITAWLWRATSPTYAVGGFAEMPAVAGSDGTHGMGSATYAVLAGAAAGVLAFAVLATLSVKGLWIR
jgi:hypothetical protein